MVTWNLNQRRNNYVHHRAIPDNLVSSRWGTKQGMVFFVHFPTNALPCMIPRARRDISPRNASDSIRSIYILNVNIK